MIASNFHVHALYTVESMPEARTFLIIVGTLLLKTHSMCEKKKKNFKCARRIRFTAFQVRIYFPSIALILKSWKIVEGRRLLRRELCPKPKGASEANSTENARKMSYLAALQRL